MQKVNSSRDQTLKDVKTLNRINKRKKQNIFFEEYHFYSYVGFISFLMFYTKGIIKTCKAKKAASTKLIRIFQKKDVKSKYDAEEETKDARRKYSKKTLERGK